MKKRILSVVLVFAMASLLVACAGNKDTVVDSEKTEMSKTEEESVFGEKDDAGVEENTNDQSKKSDDTKGEENQDLSKEDVSEKDIDFELKVDNEYKNLPESKGFMFESNGDGTCTLTKIGDCSDTNIVIPEKSPDGDTISKIGEHAFYSAEDIESIIFADRTLEIEKNAFQSCEVKKIIISGSDLTVNESAFAYSEDIESIFMNNSLVEIGEYAFYDCGKKMDVKITNCKGVFEDEAFQSCGAINLTITDSEFEIGESAFAYCDNIESMNFENDIFNIESYAFYDAGDDAAIVFKDCSLDIADEAFQSCHALTLEIKGSETKMGENTFSYCKELTDVIIGANNTEIGSYSFYDCTDLVNVFIAEDSNDDAIVIQLDDNAFQSSSVQNVVIGKGQVEIGENAFSYCEELKNVEFKGNSLDVGEYAFYECPAELSIHFNGEHYNKESIEELR